MKTTSLNSNFCVVARILLFCFLLSFTAFTFAQKVLKPEEAFPVEVTYKDQRLQISHEIRTGYYLYRDKISYESRDKNINLGTTRLPPGKDHFDEFFGNTKIYRDAFIVDIPVDIDETTVSDNTLFIEIKLQGCADIGLCYPPQTWQREISLNQENDGVIVRGSDASINRIHASIAKHFKDEIANKEQFAEMLKPQTLQAILELMKDGNWRIGNNAANWQIDIPEDNEWGCSEGQVFPPLDYRQFRRLIFLMKVFWRNAEKGTDTDSSKFNMTYDFNGRFGQVIAANDLLLCSYHASLEGLVDRPASFSVVEDLLFQEQDSY